MLTPQDKQELTQLIKSNQHEVYVVSLSEMENIIKSSPKGNSPKIQEAWSKIKGSVANTASYSATASDVFLLSKLVGDLGGIGAQAYVKHYGGKPHIILKGRPGLRKILTGTKYGVTNPKVVRMGLGKVGAVKAARSGGVLTIILLTAFRVVDYFLTDKATLNQLIGTLATDVVKVGIATGVSIAAATLMAGAATMLAIGPLAVAIVAGVLTSVLLENLDTQLGVTEKVIQGLDEISQKTSQLIDQTRQNLHNTFETTKRNTHETLEKAANSVFDYVLKSTERVIINWAKSAVRRLVTPTPRF